MIEKIMAAWPDVVGMIGVLFILIAYYFLNTHKMNANHSSYQWLNLWGSIFILISLLYSWNLSSVVIEIAWFIISVIGLRKIHAAHSSRHSQ